MVIISVSPHCISFTSKNAPCRRPFLVFGAWRRAAGRAWRQLDLVTNGSGNMSWDN